MKIPSLTDMLQAGVHFGHQVSRWHPKMKRFIFTQRNGVHVINLEETQRQLEETLNAVRDLAAQGKNILFISTKPQAREIVRQAAIACNMPYLVDRWVGGLLTNFPEIKKLIKKYVALKKQQESGELERYTKKEQLDLSRQLEKMDKTLGGLASLDKMPEVLFVPSVQREKTAMIEANKMNVTVVGVCDTNANPDKVSHVIPANDDAVNAITMMVNLVSEAAKDGRAQWEKTAASAKASAAKQADGVAAESKKKAPRKARVVAEQ